MEAMNQPSSKMQSRIMLLGSLVAGPGTHELCRCCIQVCLAACPEPGEDNRLQPLRDFQDLLVLPEEEDSTLRDLSSTTGFSQVSASAFVILAALVLPFVPL